MNEVDLIVHYMRQSKMDAVRGYLEKLVSGRFIYASKKPPTAPLP